MVLLQLELMLVRSEAGRRVRPGGRRGIGIGGMIGGMRIRRPVGDTGHAIRRRLLRRGEELQGGIVGVGGGGGRGRVGGGSSALRNRPVAGIAFNSV